MSLKPLLILCVSSGLALPSGERTRPARIDPRSALAFENLALHLEVDVPDWRSPEWGRFARFGNLLALPAELVLEVEAGAGLSELLLTDAEGRTRLELAKEELASIEISELTLESEKATLAEMLEEFPAGSYHVAGRTSLGQPVTGTVELSHAFPGLFTMIHPRQSSVLALDDARLSWSPSQRAVRYLLEIEDDESGFALELKLPATRTSVTLPADLLEPGREYEYSLVAEGDTDNEVEIEGTFRIRHRPSIRR